MHDSIKSQLITDGYAILEDFLHVAECDEIKAAGLEFTENLPDIEERATFSTTEKTHLKDKYFLESNDKIRCFFEEGAIDADGNLTVEPEISLNKVGHALHLLHPIFRCYTYSERVKSICKELGFIEPAVVQSMYIFKNPGIGSEVVAHQDATYLYTEPTPPVGFWIALEEATVQNGCLWLSRGSHRSGVHRRLIRNPDEDSDEALIYDKPAAVYPQSSFTPIPVSKGTCILLHGNVVHKSSHNKSDKSRHAYTFHVVETYNNLYSTENWLQEGEDAPFCNLYNTLQMI